MTPGRILVVDDDPWIQRIVARALGQRGHQVSLAGDATGAFVVASKIKPDLIVTAISLPAIEGLGLVGAAAHAARLRRRADHLPAVGRRRVDGHSGRRPARSAAA